MEMNLVVLLSMISLDELASCTVVVLLRNSKFLRYRLPYSSIVFPIRLLRDSVMGWNVSGGTNFQGHPTRI